MGLLREEQRAAKSVLHVGKYYPPYDGGIENHVQSLCTGLRDRYDVTALVFNTRRETVQETLDGVKVIRVSSLGRIFSTEISPSYPAWFSRLSRVDIVHLHVPNPVGELACLAIRRGARLVVTYHSDVIRQRLLGRANRQILHRVLSRADRIIVFTRRYMESSPVLRHHSDKCAIIPHGIDLDEMKATDQVLRAAADLRRRHGEKIVLFVGRLVYYKGVEVLLEALSFVPGAELLIVGDGPMRAPLEDTARRLGVSGRVRFMGKVTHQEKVAACHAADFLVLPATHRSEAFGLVQVEALAAGLPVICTNIDSGVPFVNQDGVTGLVVEPGNATELAAAMRSLFENREMAAGFRRAACQRAADVFSRDVMIRDVQGVYESLLAGRAGVRDAARQWEPVP